MTAEAASVLIVGTDHAALAAALFLARQGVRPIVVAPAAACGDDRPWEVSRATFEVYRALGLGRAVLGATEGTGRPGERIAPRGRLSEVLAEAGRGFGAVIRLDSELTRLESTPDGAVAILRGRDGHDSRTVRARYLVRSERCGTAGAPVVVHSGDAGSSVCSARTFVLRDRSRMRARGPTIAADIGVADALNLCWKLAAVIDGYAGPRLLESYLDERFRLAQESTHSIGADAGRAGVRAPQVRLRARGRDVAIHDAFYRGFVLLTANRAWAAAADRLAVAAELPLKSLRIGGTQDEADFVDVDGRWPRRYGVGAHGAVLVRPDGVVAWVARQTPNDGARCLAQAFCALLGDRSTSEEMPGNREPVDLDAAS